MSSKTGLPFKKVMATLKRMGTAQNVKVYRRHGAGDNVYGVSWANLTKLKKQIRTDQALAERLWETGNADARILAVMVADPGAVSPKLLTSWLNDVRFYGLADLIAALAARTRFASELMARWRDSPREFVQQSGYSIVCGLFREGAELSDPECGKILARVEKDIHQAPNRARHAMNMALIAVGIYKPDLRDQAIAAARRIGKVEVDHGETGCKTPEAEATIRRAAERKKKIRMG